MNNNGPKGNEVDAPNEYLGRFPFARIWGRLGKKGGKCHVDTLDMEMFKEWYLNKIGERYKIRKVIPKWCKKNDPSKLKESAYYLSVFGRVKDYHHVIGSLSCVRVQESRQVSSSLVGPLFTCFFDEKKLELYRTIFDLPPHPGFQSPRRLFHF